jgi:hypothetical protein
MKKALAEIMKPGQFNRYRELSLQHAGIMAIAAGMNAELQKDLNITEAQKEKISGIEKDLQAQMREARQSAAGDFAAMREKMQPIRKEAEEKVTKVLTDDQNKTWKDMIGAPFTFLPPRPRNPQNF